MMVQEGLIWADVFEKYRSLIKKGQLLVVEGIVERDNYSDSIKYKIIAERIMTFDQARREYIKNIKISINSDLENIISDIKEIANSKDGNSILISYKGDSANADISLPNEYTVELNDDSIRKKRFGTENIQFVYHSQNHIN